ncbi:gliding motility-associated C-terminal domain-containing protein [Flavobacterium sp. JP2137]|uniref:T9SS type B sorting domain-containing protein n=1 Tax=Flavobacterium sp. JP2137 TaxID=3414510 RepID=UPI003D2FE7CA
MMLKRVLVITLLFCFNAALAQQLVKWVPAINSNVMDGFYYGGTVTVIQEGEGNDLTFSSPHQAPSLMGYSANHFTTQANPQVPPSKKITFNFSPPVVISRLNIGDINMSPSHNDSFNIRGVTFTSVEATGVTATINSATATHNSYSNAMWHMSTTPISSFSINYSTTNGKTHSFIIYALEVLVPPPGGGGPGGPGNGLVNICRGESVLLEGDPVPTPNIRYEWDVPDGFPNPGNVSLINTTIPGEYALLALNETTGLLHYYRTWSVFPRTPDFTTFTNLPTSICPDKTTLNSPLPSISVQGNSGNWSQMSSTDTTVTYRFQPHGQCVDPYEFTIPILGITPLFATHDPVCHIDQIILPTVSINNFTGQWTLIASDITSATYKFTPARNQCATEAVMKVQIKEREKPYFNLMMPACASANFDFPLYSTNHIKGTWKLLSNDSEKETYEFTPDDLICYEKLVFDIFHVKKPEFNLIKSVCNLSDIDLPTTSINGFTGEWTKTKQTTNTIEYLFTPNEFCVETYSVVITIQDKKIPLFNAISVNCKFDEEQLPPTSTNGIQGSWKLTQEHGNLLTYTFTPSSGQCATQTTMEIVDTTESTVEFDPQCVNDQFFLLTKLYEGPNLIPIVQYEYYYNGKLVSEKEKLNITELAIRKEDWPAVFDVIVMNESGCLTSGSIRINNLDCAIPKGISPDMNMINDNLDLKNFQVRKLIIYNRLGRVVYEKSHYKDEWYGQNNQGNTLPAGTYFYQIEFLNDSAPRTGWIYLNTPK